MFGGYTVGSRSFGRIRHLVGVLVGSLGLLALMWALTPRVARAQDEDVAPSVEAGIDVCDVHPEFPECQPMSDEAFDAWLGSLDATAHPVAPSVMDALDGPLPPEQHRLAVPRLSQRDSRWRNVVMRTKNLAIGTDGCALTSANMLIRYFGSSQLPPTLNACLGQWACDLYWTQVPRCSNGRASWVGSAGFSYGKLRQMVDKGVPPIVKVSGTDFPTHFVVVIGYEFPQQGGSWEDPRLYFINDPWTGTERRLNVYTSYVGLRIYGRASN